MQDALITLTGNVGTEVDHTRGEGWQLARFRLACTPRRLREGQWCDTETTWISVTVWGRTAENVAASLTKGDPVVVMGRLRTSAWTDQDGLRQERLVVEASAIGHDLSRGRAEFSRHERRQPVPDEVQDDTGNWIAVETGEVLPREADEDLG